MICTTKCEQLDFAIDHPGFFATKDPSGLWMKVYDKLGELKMQLPVNIGYKNTYTMLNFLFRDGKDNTYGYTHRLKVYCKTLQQFESESVMKKVSMGLSRLIVEQ